MLYVVLILAFQLVLKTIVTLSHYVTCSALSQQYQRLPEVCVGVGIDEHSISQENAMISLLLKNETEYHFESPYIGGTDKRLGKRPFKQHVICLLMKFFT